MVRGYPVKCRFCGCTEDMACAGGCSWTLDDKGKLVDVCSACVDELEPSPTDNIEWLQLMVDALDALDELQVHLPNLEELLFHGSLVERVDVAAGLIDCPIFLVHAASFYHGGGEFGVRPGALVQAIATNHDLTGINPQIQCIPDPRDLWGKRPARRPVCWIYTYGLQPLTPAAWEFLVMTGDRRLPVGEIRKLPGGRR